MIPRPATNSPRAKKPPSPSPDAQDQRRDCDRQEGPEGHAQHEYAGPVDGVAGGLAIQHLAGVTVYRHLEGAPAVKVAQHPQRVIYQSEALSQAA